jgi:2',3'-cyclic-nucleotide 2'-phosphodiesterase (5'-nucleotidase family)
LNRYPAHLVVDAGGWAERANPDRPELRSRFVLQGLHALGLEIANLSSRELKLGPAALRALADSTQVQFVSANIRIPGAAGWLKPYLILNRSVGGRAVRIGVVGVSLSGPDIGPLWPDSLAPKIDDPIAAAEQVLATLTPETDLQVLLAYLPAAELDRDSTELGGYDLLVSGVGDLRETPPAGKLPVVLSPGTRCKFSGWVALRPTDGTSYAVADGGVVQLDTKVPDDPAMAKLVQKFKDRLGPPPGIPAGAPAIKNSAAPGTSPPGHSPP